MKYMNLVFILALLAVAGCWDADYFVEKPSYPSGGSSLTGKWELSGDQDLQSIELTSGNNYIVTDLQNQTRFGKYDTSQTKVINMQGFGAIENYSLSNDQMVGDLRPDGVTNSRRITSTKKIQMTSSSKTDLLTGVTWKISKIDTVAATNTIYVVFSKADDTEAATLPIAPSPTLLTVSPATDPAHEATEPTAIPAAFLAKPFSPSPSDISPLAT